MKVWVFRIAGVVYVTFGVAALKYYISTANAAGVSHVSILPMYLVLLFLTGAGSFMFAFARPLGRR